jgi:hypothetical protein
MAFTLFKTFKVPAEIAQKKSADKLLKIAVDFDRKFLVPPKGGISAKSRGGTDRKSSRREGSFHPETPDVKLAVSNSETRNFLS